MAREMERLSNIVNEVGRRDGVDDLRLGSEGTAALTFKSGKRIFFEYVEESARLFVYTPLMHLPPDEERLSTLLKSMLTCNFLKLDTGKGELSISPDMQQAIYQVGLDIHGLDADQLDNAINDVLKQRDECLYQLEHGQSIEVKVPRAFAGTSTFHRLARLSQKQE